jgi:DNA polymerase
MTRSPRVRPEVLEALGLGPAWVLRQEGGSAGDGTPADAGAASGHTPSAGLPLEPAGADAQAHARSEAILGMDWDALETAVAQCTACPLARTRTRTVFGVGDRAADWLFVGEGPGADEDLRGEPFVGQAGRLLDAMLAAIDLKRGRDVFIANVVKCRPPGNRNPEPAESGSCMPFLQRQVELIRPRLIVALGKVAAANLLGREVAVAALRGRLHDYRGIPLLVTYHPAYLLRNLADKARAWEDLCLARDTMARLKAGEAAGG